MFKKIAGLTSIILLALSVVFLFNCGDDDTEPGTSTGTETGTVSGTETGTTTGTTSGSQTGTTTGTTSGSQTGTQTGTATGTQTGTATGTGVPAKEGSIISFSGPSSVNTMTINAYLTPNTGLTASHNYTYYQVEYNSRGPANQVRPCTGIIAFPDGTFSSGSVVMGAVNHGTTGIADACAPSTLNNIVNAETATCLSLGIPFVMSDYVGFSTNETGIHPYLVLEAEAFSIIDGLRALQELAATASFDTYLSSKVVMQGHSQGGHATLSAHDYMDTYGSEFDLLGSVCLAPAAEFKWFISELVNGTSSNYSFVSYAIFALDTYYGYNDLTTYYNTTYAADIPTWADSECLATFEGHFTDTDPNTYFNTNFITAASNSFVGFEPFHTHLVDNEPGNFTSSSPIIIYQGDNDTIVFPEVASRLFTRLCNNNNTVEHDVRTGETHTTIVTTAAGDAKTWLEARINGTAATSECP